jgi:hypothetical protein
MKLQFHGSCLLAPQSCRFITFLEHNAAVSLLSGSTKLQFHRFLATRSCSFIALWQYETAAPLLPGSTKLQFHIFLRHEAAISWTVHSVTTKLPFHLLLFLEHEAASSLLSGSTKLQFHCFRAARNCSFIAFWQHETAVSLLPGHETTV